MKIERWNPPNVTDPLLHDSYQTGGSTILPLVKGNFDEFLDYLIELEE